MAPTGLSGQGPKNLPRPPHGLILYARAVNRALALGQGFTNGVGHEGGDHVRVGVGVGATILDIALAVLGNLPRDTNRGASV